jgi:uncharacterized protein (DUF885 family)
MLFGTIKTTILSLACTLAGAQSPERALAAYFQEYLDAWFSQQPLAATRLGDHRFGDKLDDISPEARAKWLERDKHFLADLSSRVEYNKLARAGQIDFEIFKRHLEREIWLAEHFDEFRDDPRVYVSYATECVYLPLTQSSESREKIRKDVAERLKEVPRIVAEAKRSVGKPPRVKTETAIAQAKGSAAFYRGDFFNLFGESLVGQERDAHAAAKAMDDLAAFLETEVLPRADGEWRIGRELFAEKLDLELDAGLTAAEVVQEAEREASRVEQEMYYVAKELWPQTFPGRTQPPDDVQGRRDTIKRVMEETSKRHGSPDALILDARHGAEAIKQFIREHDVLALPEPDRCAISEMPEFKRGNSMAYLNSAPPLDPAVPSEYAISPPPSAWSPARVESFLREYNSSMLQILTIHEAYPGHYVQLEYSNKTPSLIRRVLQSGPYVEGWAVYTEQMMLDEGYGSGDLVLRLNQLKFYLRAVINAILDHKMHCEELTDEQALEMLVGRAFQTEGEALPKIVRAKQSSCQLSTYFVGRTAMYRLRQAVQRELGDSFSLGRYHEAVLSEGSIPVKFLPELVGPPQHK